MSEILAQHRRSCPEAWRAGAAVSVLRDYVEAEGKRAEIHAYLLLERKHSEVFGRKILEELRDQSRRREIPERKLRDREVCVYIHDAVGRQSVIEHAHSAGFLLFRAYELRHRVYVLYVQLRYAGEGLLAVRRLLPFSKAAVQLCEPVKTCLVHTGKLGLHACCFLFCLTL